MEFVLSRARLRPLRPEDAPSLARHADDAEVAAHLPDRFPHPYTLTDAVAFIAASVSEGEPTKLGIEVEGEVVGTIGWKPKEDVDRVTVEVGYWIGSAHAGQGIVTEALRAVVPWLICARRLTRVEARVFAGNRGSARVLEKAGFVREAVMRRSAIKHGAVIDQELWAYVVDARGVAPTSG